MSGLKHSAFYDFEKISRHDHFIPYHLHLIVLRPLLFLAAVIYHNNELNHPPDIELCILVVPYAYQSPYDFLPHM